MTDVGKEVEAALVAWLDTDGTVVSVEVVHSPIERSASLAGTWPVAAVFDTRSAHTFTAASRILIERLRITRPSWVRLLKSRPGTTAPVVKKPKR